MLSRAIASLDGMQDVPGLNMVFDEMKRARPSSITRAAYYEAKVTEAAAMLLDWSLPTRAGAASAIRAADRSALNPDAGPHPRAPGPRRALKRAVPHRLHEREQADEAVQAGRWA